MDFYKNITHLLLLRNIAILKLLFITFAYLRNKTKKLINNYANKNTIKYKCHFRHYV